MKTSNDGSFKCRVLARYKSNVTAQKKRITPDIPLNPRLTPRGERGSSGGRNNWKLLMLIIPVTTFCLGTWQVFRLQWKVNLMADLERKIRLPPVSIPLKSGAVGELLGRKGGYSVCLCEWRGWEGTINYNENPLPTLGELTKPFTLH